MNCWKCGRPVQGNFCNACGASYVQRVTPTTETGKMLRYIYDKYGVEHILGNTQTFLRCLSDVFPDDLPMRQAMKAAIMSGGTKALYELAQRGSQPNKSTWAQIEEGICQQSSCTRADAQTVVSYLMEMIGYGVDGKNTTPRSDQPSNARPSVQTPLKSETPAKSSQNNERMDTVREVASLDRICLFGTGLFKEQEGRLIVWSDSVAFYPYRVGTKAAEAATVLTGVFAFAAARYVTKHGKTTQMPKVLIPIKDIQEIKEEFFLTARDFSLLLRDGSRFRVNCDWVSVKKKDVANAIQAIRQRMGQ